MKKEDNQYFFDGGISGFFQDLYYGAVEKGYKVRHPRCWDSVLKSQAVSCDEDDSEYGNIIEVLQSVGIEDEELFSLLEEAKDMEGMSEEEAEFLLEKLRENNN